MPIPCKSEGLLNQGYLPPWRMGADPGVRYVVAWARLGTALWQFLWQRLGKIDRAAEWPFGPAIAVAALTWRIVLDAGGDVKLAGAELIQNAGSGPANPVGPIRINGTSARKRSGSSVGNPLPKQVGVSDERITPNMAGRPY
ncbi:hypothetical protein [Chlorobium sp. N1]|uniref:hypothetical protein n=1 Tax=Chlorobium sp. N1 TaxID=2491138 RepID=UPI00103E1FE7|nr:hypothetical protein [Chlorobium sp. N1]TCD47220.1 hypothetical protein E0L29_09015 [Chlorobium sp. N1]